MVGESINIENDAQERTGIRLREQYMKEKKELTITQCKSLSEPDPKIPGSEWRECECIVYIYVKGGKDSVINRYLELHNNMQKLF